MQILHFSDRISATAKAPFSEMAILKLFCKKLALFWASATRKWKFCFHRTYCYIGEKGKKLFRFSILCYNSEFDILYYCVKLVWNSSYILVQPKNATDIYTHSICQTGLKRTFLLPLCFCFWQMILERNANKKCQLIYFMKCFSYKCQNILTNSLNDSNIRVSK